MKINWKRFIEKNKAVLFLLPSLSGFMVFYVIPFFWGFKYALYDKPVDGSFVGLENFLALWKNSSFTLAFGNTVRFISVAVPLNVFLPLIISLFIRYSYKGRWWFQNIFLSPLIVPTATIAFFWTIVLDQKGPVNYLLSLMNLPDINFLQGGWALFSVVLIYIWKNIGYNMIIYIATLNGIPDNFYDAAKLENACPVSTFFIVTLPSITPTLFFIFVISVINCFKVFKEIYLLAGPRPDDSLYMLQHFMNNMFAGLNYSKLTSAAYTLAMLIIIIIYILFTFERKNHESTAMS